MVRLGRCEVHDETAGNRAKIDRNGVSPSTGVGADSTGAATRVGTLPGVKCPIDDSPLTVSSREGVEIDFCPQCRGVWLDRGELDKIVDRVANAIGGASGGAAPMSEPAGRPEPAQRDDYGYDDRRRPESDRDRKRRKRRSFLDDLFDFD